ncbi:DNA primase [Labrys miyagiensis]|uniref:DNA primase n=1 Tax=Labrys miyagiensis TaxID=346912 RepID=A0ABQ6CH88_9HYPH|nr:DNA primase [Labrys miyagiensis]GLS19520.1 DNA primase [Labrys miyagiensis]
MKYPPNLLDEIRARLPVTAVVGRRVKLKKQGREWRGLSPFNAEKTPSFYVNDQKGFYHCFSSGRHGDIFRFLMETEGVSFPEAVERCAGEAGVILPKLTAEDIKREEERASLHEVMEMAAAFFQSRLQAREGAAARGYLADRGLTPAIQAEFGIGYSPNERFALRDHLAGKGVDRDAMIEAGLLVHGEDIQVPYDRFRDRIMFPIHDARGKVIAFGGRAMDKEASAKYLNSPETSLFHKGSCLYNHHRARKASHEKGGVIAVEGYVDVIMMSVAGFGHTVAPLGTALTEDQLTLLWRMSEEPVLCFDGDKAGRKAAYRAIDVALPQIGPGKTLKFALLPSGQDPDELVRSSGASAVSEVLQGAMPLADMLWTRETESGDFETPERRAALERKVMDALTPIRDETLRKHYRAEMQGRLNNFFAPVRAAEGRFEGGQRSWRRGPGGRQETRSGPPPVTAGVRESARVRGGHGVVPAREALILAAVVAHPVLLDDHCELLAGLEFDNAETNRLRQALIDCVAHGLRESPEIETELLGLGFERLLHQITSASALGHFWVRRDAAFPDVRDGFVHAVALHHKNRTLHKELRLAATALEQDLTDENFARLQDIKAQIATMEGTEAMIEGFGASSGRSSRDM